MARAAVRRRGDERVAGRNWLSNTGNALAIRWLRSGARPFLGFAHGNGAVAEPGTISSLKNDVGNHQRSGLLPHPALYDPMTLLRLFVFRARVDVERFEPVRVGERAHRLDFLTSSAL